LNNFKLNWYELLMTTKMNELWICVITWWSD